MKQLILTLALCIGCINSNIAQVEELEVEINHHKLLFGKSITIDQDINITFKALSGDSRCPKEVMCVRAGEAIATIEIRKKGELLETTDLKFYPHGVVETLSKVLAKYKITVTNLKLLPYPTPEGARLKSFYHIEFTTLETQ
jgi:hypothetical protein